MWVVSEDAVRGGICVICGHVSVVCEFPDGEYFFVSGCNGDLHCVSSLTLCIPINLSFWWEVVLHVALYVVVVGGFLEGGLVVWSGVVAFGDVEFAVWVVVVVDDAVVSGGSVGVVDVVVGD